MPADQAGCALIGTGWARMAPHPDGSNQSALGLVLPRATGPILNL